MPPACEPRRSYRSSSPISIVTGCSSGSSRARARRIDTSFSRPSCLRYCMNGGASRTRRAGCLPVSPGCFPATAGSIGVRASCIGNVSATALRFFFKITLKRHDLAEELISTREPRRLPVVLSPEEVGRLLAAATNTKHRAILSLAYATGLRSSEVVSLKLTDIDRHRMLIRVEQGKGKKDRYVILSPILLEILHEWWRVARQKGWMSAGQPWLFPGYRGQHTSARQLHRIVRLAAGRAGITKRIGVHTLRHCFAT